MRNTVTVNQTKSLLNSDIKYIFQSPKNHIFTHKIHTHTFYEFIFVLSGACVHYVDGNSYDMKKHDFILLCPGNRHCFMSQTHDIALLCISIAKDEFQKFELLYGQSLTGKNAKIVSLNKHFCEKFSSVISEMNNPTQNEIRAICSLLFSNYVDVSVSKSNIPEAIQKMTDKMLNDVNLLQEGLKAMIKLSNYSEAQLGRLMRKYYGTSPHSHLKHLRLQTAYNYILQTDTPLEEVSMLCGYNCYGYFTTIFKEKYGISPAVLRKTKH